jgi:hemimethylated DNA binding protein
LLFKLPQTNMNRPAAAVSASELDRDQPWYHLLVGGSSTCTCAASQNLVADSSDLPIEHPLLPHFFSEFLNGGYIRNDEPWPA